MKNKSVVLLLIGVLFHLTSGCSIQWTEAIRYGKITPEAFQETVDIEIHNGLIFMPVTIRGKEYRFLFDSGAPFSISNQLQQEHAFKIVSKGNIIDSDHNRKKVEWVQVDAINIGTISFTEQSAFVGDFDANPLFKCLKIDGIIGSNIMRHCNWTIDQEQASLSLFDAMEKDAFEEDVSIPFKTDYQYNVFIDVDLGQVTVKNILMDYGSNGSFSLNDEIFSTLKEQNIIRETLVEKGIQQSGIIGETVNLNREITYTDSIRVGGIPMKNVMLRTGKTVSVGNALLSRFRITIDWENKYLHLVEIGKVPDSNRSAGFKLGYTTDKGVYVQSVIEQSDAYNKGVRPNMRVAKIDHLDFASGYDFCDYVNHKLGDEISLQLIDSQGQKQAYDIEKTSF